MWLPVTVTWSSSSRLISSSSRDSAACSIAGMKQVQASTNCTQRRLRLRIQELSSLGWLAMEYSFSHCETINNDKKPQEQS